jgi:hypothetical protein
VSLERKADRPRRWSRRLIEWDLVDHVVKGTHVISQLSRVISYWSLIRSNNSKIIYIMIDLIHSPARLSPPLSTNKSSQPNLAWSSSYKFVPNLSFYLSSYKKNQAKMDLTKTPKLAEMSSLIAAWGQPPVSTALILSLSGKAEFLIRNSASSLVKISFVKTAFWNIN